MAEDPNSPLHPGEDVPVEDPLTDGEDEESDNEEDETGLDEELVKLTVGDIKPGLTFTSKESAMKSLKKFYSDNYHPFILAVNSDTRVRFVCTHGHRRRYKATEARPHQRVNFTGCTAGVNINKQPDGKWAVGSKAELDHSGHGFGPDAFKSYSFNKKLSEADKDLLLDLARAKAPARKIAEVLTQRTGSTYLPKDVSNLIQKFKSSINDDVALEKDLADIIREGGNVRWSKDKDTGYINVLFIQTEQMKSSMASSKPTVFQADSTFNTNAEGYKGLSN